MDYAARKKESEEKVWEALISQNYLRYLWAVKQKKKHQKWKEREHAKETQHLSGKSSSTIFSH